MQSSDQLSATDPAAGATVVTEDDLDAQWSRVVKRRSFLKGMAIAGAAAVPGSALHVRPLNGQRQMAGPLLHVNHSPSQQAVRRPTFLCWSLLIADRRQQRVNEAHALAFEHEDTLTNGDVERIADRIRAAEYRNNELDPWSASHRRREHDVADLARQTCEALAEQHAETVGHSEARPAIHACPIAGQLQREERVAAGRVMDQSQVGRPEFDFQTFSEQSLQGTPSERIQRQPRDPLPGKRALELERHSRVRLVAQRHEDTDGLVTQSTIAT